MAFNVTFCTSIIDRNIRRHRFDPRERRMGSAVQNSGNPLHTPGDKVGRIRQRLSIREQVVDVLDTIRHSMSEERLFKGPEFLRIRHNLIELIVRKKRPFGGSCLIINVVKNILLHREFSFVIV